MVTQDVRETIQQATDAMTARRVFGDPYERNGLTVIPAARVQGGGGGGGGEGPDGQGRGSGSGFGLNARPTGAFVIRGDEVVWRPAVDVNRVILGAQLVAVAALLLARTIVKARTIVRVTAAPTDERSADDTRHGSRRRALGRKLRSAIPFTGP